MIVSIHIPKSAGTTFCNILQAHFKTHLYYEQKPLLHRFNQTPMPIFKQNLATYEAIHGHFVADSLNINNPTYITWVRHPVDRLVSHYFHWQRHPDSAQKLSLDVARGRLSLEEFAKTKTMRDLQSFFLGGGDIQNFAFVGIMEEFNASMQRFEEQFSIKVETIQTLNVNAQKRASYQEIIGDALYKKIEGLNEKDMKLYNQAKSMLCKKR